MFDNEHLRKSKITTELVSLACFLDNIERLIKEFTLDGVIYNYIFNPEYECDFDYLDIALEHECEKANKDIEKAFISFAYREDSTSNKITLSISQVCDTFVKFEILILAEKQVIDLSDMTVKPLSYWGIEEEEED